MPIAETDCLTQKLQWKADELIKTKNLPYTDRPIGIGVESDGFAHTPASDGLEATRLSSILFPSPIEFYLMYCSCVIRRSGEEGALCCLECEAGYRIREYKSGEQRPAGKIP